MKSTQWEPQRGDELVATNSWNGDERLLTIVTVHKRGTFVTVPADDPKSKTAKQTWKPNMLGNPSATLKSGGGRESARPATDDDTLETVAQRNAERAAERERERAEKHAADVAKREKWLDEFGAELDRALGAPIPVHDGAFQMYVATVKNHRGQWRVVTFHVRDDRLIGKRDKPRMVVYMGLANVEIGAHKSDGTDVEILGGISSTSTRGDGLVDDPVAIKWALAGYFT